MASSFSIPPHLFVSPSVDSTSFPVTGIVFLDAFRTVLVREYQATGISITEWAQAARVERRSLDRFVQQGRGVGCAYAWRLCESLGLRFDVVVQTAVELAFRQTAGGRFTWKASLLRGRSQGAPVAIEVTMEEARLFSRHLCTLLHARLVRCGLSKSELARRGGVDRTALSRLHDDSRQNLTLPVLFDIAFTLGEPLDKLSRSAAKASRQEFSRFDQSDFPPHPRC